jgi:replicative DNA helicase
MDARIPPYNLEAENAILGIVLLDNRSLLAIKGESVTADTFYVEANRRIFQAMIDLDLKGEPIDHLTLSNKLEEKGDLQNVGGTIGLGKLTNNVATVKNVAHYATIVKNASARRNMIYTAQQVVAEGFANDQDTQEFLSKSRSEVTQAANSLINKSAGPKLIDDDLVEIYEEIAEKKTPEGLIKTGLGTIDNVTGGLWPGLMYVIAGRPGMGKSAFILNIGNNVAMRGQKVLYITLEDVRKLVVYRMLARYADIDLDRLMLRNVNSQEEYTRILEAMNKMGNKKPFWVEDASALTSEQIAQIAANHKEIHGLDLLIIDHLGEIGDKGESKTVITTDAARNFRDIGKDLHIPVILASQLNRQVEQRNDKRPMLSDLRQSGEIEACARAVWLLYRDGYYLGEAGNERRDMEVIIAKSNHGRLGMVKHYARLKNMYIRGWDTHTDGLWPNDEDKSEVPESRKANKGEYFNSGKQSHWQDKDNY